MPFECHYYITKFLNSRKNIITKCRLHLRQKKNGREIISRNKNILIYYKGQVNT